MHSYSDGTTDLAKNPSVLSPGTTVSEKPMSKFQKRKQTNKKNWNKSCHISQVTDKFKLQSHVQALLSQRYDRCCPLGM